MSRNYRKICKQLARRFLFALVLMSAFSLVSFAQTEESEETLVVVPVKAMEQIVRRILVWHFKPRNQKKVIYLAEKGLQKSWLPKIEGVEFQLLSATDVEEKDGVYFFTKLEQLSKSKYRIGFAFGDSSCDFTAHSWYFRISEQRVRLWQDGSGFGGGCGRGNSF